VEGLRVRGVAEAPEGFDFFIREGGYLGHVKEGVEGFDAGGRFGYGLGGRRWWR
jgi:hypothetical protein